MRLSTVQEKIRHRDKASAGLPSEVGDDSFEIGNITNAQHKRLFYLR